MSLCMAIDISKLSFVLFVINIFFFSFEVSVIYILAIKNSAQALRCKVFLIKTQTKATSKRPTVRLRSKVL